MSMFRAFRSGGRVNERGIFDFSDEFGQDPIRARYANTTMAQRDSETRVRLAASEIELAKASLEASMRPAQAMSDFFTSMNSAVAQKTAFESQARSQAQAAQAADRLSKAASVADLTAIQSQFPEALADERFSKQFDATRLTLRTKTLGELASRFNSAATTDDILQATADLPVEFLADEDFNRNVTNLSKAAEARVSARRAALAASAISGATGTQETLNARMQYADVLGDPKVQAASEIAGRQSSAMRGLTQLGVEAMPVTREGRFDIDRAENIVETLGRTDIRTLSAAQRGIQKQLEDPMLDPEGPEAKALQSDLTNINRQIAGITSRSDQQTTRAAMDLQSLGGTNPDWIDEIIGGGGGAPDSPPTAAPATVPTPAPDSPAPTPTTPSPQTDSAESEKKEKQKPYDPKDRAELARLELEVQKARQEAGLMNQPAGIRQINEALAAQNAPVREKVAQLEAAQERINPFAEANAKDAQTIQAALDVVYPEMDGGGFDVGSAEDSRVVSAAEFLRRVDPSLLRMVASSPGSNRAGLSLEEISNIAAKATRSARGRKQK